MRGDADPDTEVVRHATQLAVVGAGPAGVAAALEAARAGARVVIVDEGARAGGQIYRQVPASYREGESESVGSGQSELHAHAHSPGHARGEALLRDLSASGVPVLSRATVWDASPRHLSFEQDGRAHVLACERLVLAPGAYDQCIPFPGWTLPGVITAGAAQVMVRGYRVAPGRRALVAGTGPLLLPTVTALISAGTEVVAVVEANGWRARLRAGMAVVRRLGRLREAFHYLRALRRHRVDHRSPWTIVRADGPGVVESATIARIDRSGRVHRGTEQRLDVDVVCTGFGLLPSIELARALGCTLRHLPVRGGWVPAHDEHMRTSVEGVFVAGEIAGIGGADVAVAEGRIAGIAAAMSLGRIAPGGEHRLRQLRRVRASERQVSDGLLAAFQPPAGLYDLADDDTVVCRCEDVTLRQLRSTARVFGTDLRSLKMGSRAGMGPCQGRVCQGAIWSLANRRLAGREDRMPCPVVQVPVKPVSVATMLATGPGPRESG